MIEYGSVSPGCKARVTRSGPQTSHGFRLMTQSLQSDRDSLERLRRDAALITDPKRRQLEQRFNRMKGTKLKEFSELIRRYGERRGLLPKDGNSGNIARIPVRSRSRTGVRPTGQTPRPHETVNGRLARQERTLVEDRKARAVAAAALWVPPLRMKG